ncbi:hypothetical protein THAOC_00965, partial [Thalassiosira oceanica]
MALSSMSSALAVAAYSHLCIALLCLNVTFDLLVFGMPIFILRTCRVIPNKVFLSLTTALINWTTPCVLMPLVLSGTRVYCSGTRVYCNNPDLLAECKAGNSLLLANHGSVRGSLCSPLMTHPTRSLTFIQKENRLDGVFVGHARDLAGRKCERVRVGFVCEALIQFMPLIGWYRRLVARDIFVWRSFKKDSPTIKENISEFHAAGEKRMLFLSPEGVVVDFSQKDIDYIRSCRQFCVKNSFSPFDYILTPRYKGSMCLLQQVEDNVAASSSVKPVISVCNAIVRGGKLLNCSLLSPDR